MNPPIPEDERKLVWLVAMVTQLICYSSDGKAASAMANKADAVVREFENRFGPKDTAKQKDKK